MSLKDIYGKEKNVLQLVSKNIHPMIFLQKIVLAHMEKTLFSYMFQPVLHAVIITRTSKPVLGSELESTQIRRRALRIALCMLNRILQVFNIVTKLLYTHSVLSARISEVHVG